MSAFICSPEHIATLVVYYRQAGYPGERFDLEYAADTLMRANIASVAYRYPGDGEGARPGPVGYATDGALIEETKRLAMDTEFHREVKKYKPVEIIKLAQSLDYQSCESPEWENTPAKALIDSIIFRAATWLPGYNEAPWGI